jgi:hypothetical protein
MALVSLHTRLFTLLTEANAVRQMCAEHKSLMDAGSVSANVVVGLAQRLQASLANIVAPAEGDEALVEYAAAQFADRPEWVPLDQQIAGIKYLLQQVIVACKGCVPVDGSGRILKDTWNADGSVSVLAATSTDTADLRTALGAVLAAIPE